MERVNSPSRLTLRLQTDFNADKGQAVVRAFSFGNIVAGASDAAVLNLANVLLSLSALPLVEIVRTDSATLSVTD